MILIPIYTFINRLWGSGWFKGNKILAVLLSILSMIGAIYYKGYGLEKSLVIGTLSGGLYFLGRVYGGYFCCFNPTLFNEKENISWIAKVCNKILPTSNQSTDNRKRLWGLYAMTLRSIYHLPQVLILAYLKPVYLLLSFGVVLHGLIYAATYYLPKSWWEKQRQIPIAEYAFGGFLGLLKGIGL